MILTKLARPLALAAVVGGLALGGISVAQASHDGGGSGQGPDRAASYINPDNGMLTENPDVNDNSNCRRPDQFDNQPLSNAGMTNRNVHNDACLFRGYDYDSSVSTFDGPASFEATGAGYISGCPDPDGAGPKVARTSGDDGFGRPTRCFQSGYQQKGTAGDKEFHARLNSDRESGEQVVTFCYDPEQNGCGDARVTSRISIRWGQPNDTGSSWDGGSWGR